MGEVFRIYNNFIRVYPDHNSFLKKVLSFFDAKAPTKNHADYDLFESLKRDGKFDPLKAFQLVGLIHQKRRSSEKIVNTDKRKHFGIYYTDYEIARLLAKESLSKTEKKQLNNLTLYEPCVGTGIFIVAFIDEVVSRNGSKSKDTVQKLVNNIYFSDIDDEAIDILVETLPLYIKSKYNVQIKIPKFNYYKGDVLFENKNDQVSKVDPRKIFKIDAFDVVLTNPPYKLLKANGNKYKDELNENKHAVDIKKVIDFIKVNKVYNLNQGTLNYYKIFLEEILENYTHASSRVGLIIPITLLNDKQSELLRKRIINKYKLFRIYIIPEKNEFFPDISQAFCFFALDKTSPGEVIKINPRVISSKDFNDEGVEIEVKHLEKISDTSPIVIENVVGWRILEKLNNFPRLGSLSSICNARGELDLTLDKNFITTNKTSLPLIRGNNVSEFSYTTSNFYTKEKFVTGLSEKQKYVIKERIVCQQISNIHLEKRLKFTKIPGNVVLGNSCNFISFNDTLFGNQEVSLDYLLGILNSLLLNWRFKITNSNNHISNYELAELPVVIPSVAEKKNIEYLVQRIKNNRDPKDIFELNMRVFHLYGLNKKEIDYILGKHQKMVEAIPNFKTIPSSLSYAA